VKKVERTAREQREILYRRENRLYYVKWEPGTSAARRELIGKAQYRIWRELQYLRPKCFQEEQDELWPNGLPAHP
jgi:hypothetical protein